MSPTIPIPPRGGDRTSPTLEHEAPWSGSDAHGPRESGWDEQESPTWDGDRGPWRRETVLSDENPWSGHEASELEDENPWSAAETGELEDENPWSAAETGELEDETPWSDRQTLTTDDENPWSGHETGELEDENPWSGLEAGGLDDEHRDSRALDALSLDDLTSLEPTDQWSQALGPSGTGTPARPRRMVGPRGRTPKARVPPRRPQDWAPSSGTSRTWCAAAWRPLRWWRPSRPGRQMSAR